jgi:hypothetical protein
MVQIRKKKREIKYCFNIEKRLFESRGKEKAWSR